MKFLRGLGPTFEILGLLHLIPGYLMFLLVLTKLSATPTYGFFLAGYCTLTGLSSLILGALFALADKER